MLFCTELECLTRTKKLGFVWKICLQYWHEHHISCVYSVYIPRINIPPFDWITWNLKNVRQCNQIRVCLFLRITLLFVTDHPGVINQDTFLCTGHFYPVEVNAECKTTVFYREIISRNDTESPTIDPEWYLFDPRRNICLPDDWCQRDFCYCNCDNHHFVNNLRANFVFFFEAFYPRFELVRISIQLVYRTVVDNEMMIIFIGVA